MDIIILDKQLALGWANAYPWVIFMVAVQYLAMLFAKDGGKRAVDTTWYGKKEKLASAFNFFFQFLLIVLSFFVPVKYGSSLWFISGTVLYSIAFIGFVAAFQAYGTTPLGEPVSKGVYRISRNPMYFFYNLSLLAIVLITGGSLWILIPSVLFIVAAHLVILGEERYCESKYGKEYIEYKKTTPRYISLRYKHFLR